MSEKKEPIAFDTDSSSDVENNIGCERDLEKSEIISNNNNTLQAGSSSTNILSRAGSMSSLTGMETGQVGETSLKDYIRHESSRLMNQVDEAKKDIIQIDEERLQRAVKDAGEYAYGISAVEVWVMDECSGQLLRQAWWSKGINYHKNPPLKQLNDASDPDYVDRVIPGVDIAGVLFAESRNSQRDDPTMEDNSEKGALFGRKTTTKSRTFQERMSRSFDPRLLSRSFDPRRVIALFGGNPTNRMNTKPDGEHQDGIRFRDIRSLLFDPDTPKTARLALLNEAGFSKAAGVPFHSGWQNGIVLFYSSEKKTEEALVSITNLVYLKQATDLIGAVVASSDARRAAHALCLFESRPKSIVAEHAPDRDELLLQDSTSNKCTERWLEKGAKHTRRWLHKGLGGQTSQIPPALSWHQSMWTLLGSFWGLIFLTGLNEVIRHSTNDQYFFLLGPIGALSTLQYGLTSAPASQPRNIILGQGLSGIIVLPFTYISEDILPIWIRQTIATSLAIFSMAKMGVVHPPAGASAMLLASGKFGWEFYGLMVAASILSIFPCIMVNNLSAKRQYPTYWGYFVRDYLKPKD